MRKVFEGRKARIRRPSGQGLTEYAFAMAFVAVVILITFSLAQGTLFSGVSQSYSHAAGQTNRMVAESAKHQ